MKSARHQIIAITLLALALRVLQLDAQPLWWDEGYSVFFATRSFGEMLARTAVDIHPPLYYAYLQFSIFLFGSSSLALRLSSVLIGTLCIPLAYWAFKPLAAQRIALLAALLLALSPFHIFYSQELRMYGMLTLCALASFGFVVRILGAQTVSQRAPYALWLGLIVSTTAALYTEYFGAFIVGAEVVIVAFYVVRSRQIEQGDHLHFAAHPANGRRLHLECHLGTSSLPTQVLRLLAAWFAAFLLYLPWLIYAAQKLRDYVASKQGIEQYRPLDIYTFVANHIAAFSVGHLSGMTWLAWLGAIFFLGLALFEIIRQRFTHSPLQPLSRSPLLFLLAALGLAFIVNLIYPFHPARYERLLLFAAPVFYFLLAVGIGALASWGRVAAFASFGVLVLVFGLAAFNLYTVPRYTEEDYRALIQLLRQRATKDDAIIAVYPWQIGYIEAYWQTPPTIVEAPGDVWVSDANQREGDLQQIRLQHGRVWLMAYQTQGRILEAQIGNFFADDYLLTDEWFGNTRLEEFSQGTDPTITAQAIRFMENVTLAEFGATPTRVRAGQDFVLLYMRWQTNSNEYNYSLRLVDAKGQAVAQQDAPIYSDPPIQRRGLFVPRDVAKGEYSLRLVVYHAQNGEPINAVDGQASVELAKVVVE